MASPESIPALLDSAPDGLLVVDDDGRILMANSQIETLFGYTREELIGQYPETLVPDASRAAHIKYRTDYHAAPRVRPMGSGTRLAGRRKDGSEFPVEVSLSPHRTDQGTLIIAAVRDISERVRFEQERQSLLEEARAQRERERIAMDLHDGIIQSIFGVGLGLELAADEVRGTPAESVIERSIEQLNDVIRDIRGYIFELRPMSYDGSLSRSLQHLVGAFRASSPIAIELNLQGDVSGVADEMALSVLQIAQETLANVRKHSQAKHVGVALRISDHRLQLDIIDDGIGFDPFAARTEEHRGLRNLASRATSVHAELGVESAPGRGTTVSFTVPIDAPAGVTGSA